MNSSVQSCSITKKNAAGDLITSKWTEIDSEVVASESLLQLTFKSEQFTIVCNAVLDSIFLQHPPDAGNVIKRFQDEIFKRFKGLNDCSVVISSRVYTFYDSKANILAQQENIHSAHFSSAVDILS